MAISALAKDPLHLYSLVSFGSLYVADFPANLTEVRRQPTVRALMLNIAQAIKLAVALIKKPACLEPVDGN